MLRLISRINPRQAYCTGTAKLFLLTFLFPILITLATPAAPPWHTTEGTQDLLIDSTRALVRLDSATTMESSDKDIQELANMIKRVIELRVNLAKK
jgi:hypothetical protein